MSISDNIKDIKDKIGNAAARFDRLPNEIKLIAVSKTHGVDEIIEAIEAGQLDFGENKVQEALLKWPDIKKRYPEVKLHLIGGLQTNKIKDAFKVFDCIHTIDRSKLVNRLIEQEKLSGRRLEYFIQVNIGNEPQKSGAAISELCNIIDESKPLNVIGLMCIPPVEEESGKYFLSLQQMAKQYNLPKLSMGMSGDFEEAIAYGATHVRVGTAIFGKRD